MKVSLNWVRELSGVSTELPKLLELIGERLGAIDEVIDIGERYKGITIVKVVECEKHPNADKLSVCKIDDKGAVKGVKRDNKGLVQVVCGAPNVRAGMMAAWIPPGAVVPSTFGKDEFRIDARDIRGIASYGMLASPQELALGDSHEGLLELESNVRPGSDLAKTYELDDTIIDIENKMFTHRPDLFGQLGVARELAGITHKKFVSPGWYRPEVKPQSERGSLSLSIKNELPKLVPRFCAVAVGGVEVRPSPLWLQTHLAKLSVKPLNNIVDITNYLMLLSGQPLHAYDYDKVKTGTLGVRMSRHGEELKLLGGKQLKLKADAIVITDGAKPIGLGGVMGGADSEVSAETKNIILEAATFEMGITRQAANEYGLFTEAATRFTKGQSPLQNPVVLARAVELIGQLAGGKAGPMQDSNALSAKPAKLNVDANFINSRLGLNLPAVEMKRLLENVELKIQQAGDNLKIETPFWRTDIEIPEDIVEEVGRLYGYEHLPLQLPKRSISPPEPEAQLEFKARLRQLLVSAGANEVLTYSFISAELIKKAGQDARQAYRLNNPASPEFEYYRLSLLPSLLDKVHSNIKQGYESFAMFELGKTHTRLFPRTGSEKVPKQFNHLGLIFAGSAKTRLSGAAYYQARRYLDYLAETLGIDLAYEPLDAEAKNAQALVFQPGRAAYVAHLGSRTPLGVIGEFRPGVARDFKLPKFAAGFEIDTEALAAIAKPQATYHPLNRFPVLEQDICLRLKASAAYDEAVGVVIQALAQAARSHGYQWRIELLDIFQKDGSKDKQITWRVWLEHPKRTLVSGEAAKVLDKIAASAKQKLGAVRV